MNKRTGFSLAVVATAILVLFQFNPRARADDQDNGGDPPARAGRISYSEGTVSFQPGGQGDWLDAVRNRPLAVGDNVWVDKDSRAEIQIGGTFIRLGPETSITILDLEDGVTQLRLSLGSILFRVRHFDNGETFEVGTPNLAFNVSQEGEFRLDTNENGDQTVATVFHGAAEITGAGNSYSLTEGQQGTFSGTNQLSYDVGAIAAPDSLAEWSFSRDQREDQLRSRQYVSDQMTGYDDLDDYGQWRSDPDYGNVWSPSAVPAGWAPYRFGHWAYVFPWGWTWVGDEPWGFAPFHYGRWAFAGGGWCWVPGPVAVRPVYAPALVAFVGGVTIGVGTAPVGWFPLAPREVFVPWYRTSPRYVQNVNVTNTRVTVVQVTNVYNHYTVNRVSNVTYANQRVGNSVTVVNHDTFVNARPVGQNLVHVDARTLASARVTPGAVSQVQPGRQSVTGVAPPVAHRPPAQALSRPVVATRQPVALSRAAANAAPGFARPVTPPPVKTVRAAPPREAQPLQRGARGGPASNAGTQRPGGPGAQPNSPNRGAAPRPGAPAGRESGPPNAPENAARPSAPAPNRNVPRPPSANPQVQEQQRQYPGTRPENNRPENAPRTPEAGETRPPQPAARPQETPRAVPPQPAARPQQETPRARPPQPAARPQQETPRAVPPQPARPAETRPEPPSRQETRPEPRPQSERNPPRPETRQAEPARDDRAPAQHGEPPKGDRPKEDKPKNNNKFR